jgi:hypothetical protein
MSAQAETMQGMVGELVAMVGGAGKTGGEKAKPDPKTKGKARHALASAVRKVTAKAGSSRKPAQTAEEVIPLDEKEFAEF